MFNIVKKEMDWCGSPLSFETGKIARQADGAVVATYGETVVLCTVVAKREAKEGVDFFPLTINYQEKTFAAGKIPGGFFKREGRPSEKETLVSRLIDRPIRPLFPNGFFNEVQVICTVLSHDGVNDPDVLAIVGSSAALAISGIPFDGPIAGIRVCYKDGEYLFNPPCEDIAEMDLNLTLAGTEQSVLMVESEADNLSEEVMLGAVEAGHKEMQSVIQLIKDFKDEAGKDDWVVELPDHSELYRRVEALATDSLRAAYKEREKQARVEKISAAKQAAIDTLQEELGDDKYDDSITSGLLKKLEKSIVRGDILSDGTRIDGRTTRDIRNIVCETGLLPRTHGSALFTRGETQALAVATLGTGQDVQIVDALQGEYKESFMLHYNFPPYCVGEASFLRSPGRREIGHGKLAWRALKAVVPTAEEFPYTIRLVSEVTESNGSSSMATVCASSLAMMDAGVPLKAPVAGIAMGLIKEGDDFAVLSDILGDEDHLGDMDFKVAGTLDGVTSLQMDIKINGITIEIMKQALEQAKEARTHILGKMNESMGGHRDELSEHAPRIQMITIDKEKIGEVIGPGGKVIREICDTTGVKIDIDDNGTVKVASTDSESSAKALQMISDIVQEVENGKIYDGKVSKLFDFGVLVEFLGKSEGLVHISELRAERVEKIEGLYEIGDAVKVKVIGFDRGKPRLSIKRVNQESGDDLSDQFEEVRERNNDRRPSGGRDRRGGGRDNNRGNRDNNRDNRNKRKPSGSDESSSGGGNNNEKDTNTTNDNDSGSDAKKPSSESAEAPKKKRRFFSF